MNEIPEPEKSLTRVSAPVLRLTVTSCPPVPAVLDPVTANIWPEAAKDGSLGTQVIPLTAPVTPDPTISPCAWETVPVLGFAEYNRDTPVGP